MTDQAKHEYNSGDLVTADDDQWELTDHAKGWFTLQLLTDPRIEMKARHADMTPLDRADVDPLELPEDEDSETAKTKMAKQLAKYRATYVVSVASSGSKSLNNGDLVAQALEYKDLDMMYKIGGEILELNEETLRGKYEHLNKGSQRMNVGNRIRGAYKREEEKVVTWVNDEAARLAK